MRKKQKKQQKENSHPRFSHNPPGEYLYLCVSVCLCVCLSVSVCVPLKVNQIKQIAYNGLGQIFTKLGGNVGTD